MRILRTAVVGLGRIGWPYHIPQIEKHPGFVFVAGVDNNQERLAELKEIYPHAKGYLTIEEMLEAEKPELVVIASPTHLHKEHTILAMEAGADVFLDKPATRTISELEEIKTKAEASGRKVMVYQPHRASRSVNVLKDIINMDKIGPIYMVKRAVTNYNRRNDWQARKEFGGGMLNNFGAHYIDQLQYLFDTKLTAISCMTKAIATLGDAEDVVKAAFSNEADIFFDLDISQASAYTVTPWTVFGKYGTIVCDRDIGEDLCFKMRYLVPEELPEIEMQTGFAAAGRSYSPDMDLPWREECISFSSGDAIDYYQKCYEYFALDQEPFVPLEQTLSVMKQIARCREMAEKA